MTRPRDPSKRDRAQIMARPYRVVYEIVKREAARLGIPMGQYVADVLAVHVGHPELVSEPGSLRPQRDSVDAMPMLPAPPTPELSGEWESLGLVPD